MFQVFFRFERNNGTQKKGRTIVRGGNGLEYFGRCFAKSIAKKAKPGRCHVVARTKIKVGWVIKRAQNVVFVGSWFR